jgi:dipeptidyl aminopeptidase/acylaminoacyl peptidase
VTRGDLWVADADGTHTRRLVAKADQPAWSPNGRRLAFTRDGAVYTVRVDGVDERRIAPGAHPAWSPNGERIALDRDDTIVTLRWYGGGVKAAGRGSDPAYAPDGRLAVVRDGEIVAGGRVIDVGESPTWSRDGRRIAYEREGMIYVNGKAVERGFKTVWHEPHRAAEILTDLA